MRHISCPQVIWMKMKEIVGNFCLSSICEQGPTGQPGLCQWLALKPPIAQLHLGDGWDGDTSLDHLRKCLLQTFLGILHLLLFTDLDCVTAIAHLQMLVYYTLYRCTISDGVIITSKSLHANPGTQLGCQKFMQLENTWARIMCLGSQLVG